MGNSVYINSEKIKQLCAINGKQCDESFLEEIDRFIYKKILSSCRLFSGYPEKLRGNEAKRLF